MSGLTERIEWVYAAIGPVEAVATLEAATDEPPAERLAIARAILADLHAGVVGGDEASAWDDWHEAEGHADGLVRWLEAEIRRNVRRGRDEGGSA